MKKKLMASILCLSLLLIMLLGSTLAWFTDDVGTTNTMVVGNVKIDQHEKDRAGNPFVNNQPIFPAVILGKDAEGQPKINKDSNNLWDTADINNEIDKIVTVENTGISDAYIRTVFAFEMMLVNGKWENPLTNVEADASTNTEANPAEVVLNVNETVDNEGNKVQYIDFGTNAVIIYKHTENGKVVYNTTEAGAEAAYVVGVYTYSEALPKKGSVDADDNALNISAPSLLQFYLADHVGNEFYDAVGTDGYQILVLSQAVQTQGFEAEQNGRSAAEVALDTAFGAVNAENAAEWFANMQ